ncbi:MFS transporter, DHA2 family, multidrug resistance protein [Amycolatopsis marina]|uniref:MFS transporter, DHA2 family, multidrug resistance protein n=1 Tax=Amycolatopsis marina TaxID=490629 RepID=A0A1I1AEU1_9PSEU|nr:MFS transporter [Amycolatopsis marina]SFB36521.1 MFS transporter, DHA2 family, multidrug resistance protein [Amycolatopsis marina]
MSSNGSPGSGARAGAREWAGLAVLALPTLLLSLDVSVLFLALPHLSADLGASPTQSLWIMDIYGFMIAGFLVTMGTIGDRIGRRRLLLIGAAAFGIASVLAAYSGSAETLIVTRAVLGIAGATLMPSALALISNMFVDLRQRGFAIAVFVSCFMGGAALGPMFGGLLLERFWWGSVFLLGVPVMVLLLVTAPLLLPEHRDPGAGRVDLVSVLLSLLALLPVIYGLKDLAAEGASTTAVLSVAAGVAFGTAFVRRQRRLTYPLLDLRLFGNRAFSVVLGILLLGMVLQGGIYLLASQYLQLVEGNSPQTSGLLLVSPALALVAGSLLAPIFARRLGSGVVIAAGLAVSVVGFGLLTQVEPATGPLVLIIGTTVGFFGAAPIGALGIDLIVGVAPPAKSGSASAVAETSGELGIALGVATLGSVGTAVYSARFAATVPPAVPADEAGAAGGSLADAVGVAEDLPADLAADLTAAARSAFAEGLNLAGGIGAVLSLGLAVLAVTMLRHPRPGAENAGRTGEHGEVAPMVEQD